MASAPQTFGSAAARRLTVRMRPDLVIAPQSYASRRFWLVKDPVAMRYFHLGDEEHAILQMLDGRASLLEIQRRFQAAFAPLRATLEQLQGFLSHLYQCGLLLVESPGQGKELLDRGRRRDRLAWLEAMGNLLAIRLRGVDPQAFLGWLYPRCAWVFSPWFLGACLALVVGAGVLATVQFDAVARRLSESTAIFTAGNLVWLAVAVALAKGLHELAHALTCKHFGGECHEIGLMLLVFMPCLYCNVSDAWLLADKWRRIAVSAAGILAEIVLAAVCLFLWWFSEPGLVNTLLLNVVVVCSVNTVLLNGNPLLRYDGYYVLADLLEVPNLSQHGRGMVRRALKRFFVGGEELPDRYLPERRRTLVGLYGVASVAYRWCILLLILWALHKILKPHGLQTIAALVAVLAVGSMAVAPLSGLAAWFSRPGARDSFRPGRFLGSVMACGVLAAMIALVPFPFRVTAPLVLQAQDARFVYVVVPGRLASAVQVGQEVAKDQELARLVNQDIAREVAELGTQREQQRLGLANLRLRLADDPGVAPQIPAAEEAFADVESRLVQRRRDQEQLVLRAPEAGSLIPPPWRPQPPYGRGALDTWRGGLLDPRNVGAYLESGTLLGVVGDPRRLEAALVIDQADMEFVRRGQAVRLRLDQLPGRVLQGTLIEVSKMDLKLAPRELAAQSGLPIRRDRAGLPHPATTSYHALVALDDAPAGLLVGSRGQAKILVAPKSLWSRFCRKWSQFFRFVL